MAVMVVDLQTCRWSTPGSQLFMKQLATAPVFTSNFYDVTLRSIGNSPVD